MTFPRYRRLARYWRKCPPVHLLVAAFLGYEPPEETWDDVPDFNNVSHSLDDLIRDFTAAGGMVSGK